MKALMYLAALFLLSVSSWFSTASANEIAYIANENSHSVSIIDIDNNLVLGEVRVGPYPTSVSATEDGTKVFVLNSGNHTVSIIETASNTVISTIDIYYEMGCGYAEIDTSNCGAITGSLIGSPYIYKTSLFIPSEIIASSTGDKIYVASMFYGVIAVDVISGTITELASENRININDFLVAGNIDISPYDDFLYAGTPHGVIRFYTDSLQQSGYYDVNLKSIIVNDNGTKIYGTDIIPEYYSIDTETFLVDDISLNDIYMTVVDNLYFPTPISISPDGEMLYILVDSINDTRADPINITSMPAVAVIDTYEQTLLAAVPVGSRPAGIDITSDGQRIVVPNSGDDSITIIDTNSLQVIDTIAVGSKPRANRRFISRQDNYSPPIIIEKIIPDIKANNQEGPVNIVTDESVHLSISLDITGDSTIGGDWWMAVKTSFPPPNDWYSYSATTQGWHQGLTPAYQGELFNIINHTINVPKLPSGIYNFYFGVDKLMNGLPDMDDIYFDSIQVNVSDNDLRSSFEVYSTKCSVCHEVGIAGAPVTKNVEDWAPRMSKGVDIFLQNTISGINAMPPKGSCFDCTDEELLAAILYMLP